MPWAPGGPSDALARTVFNKVTEAIGQPFVLESRPGANGEIGTAIVAKAAPDGYTILYKSEGASGLRDRSHAPKNHPGRWSDEMRQAILDMRDRLMGRRGPRARYRLAGAATIRHELACLGYEPLPSIRTIERMLQQGDRTSPAFRRTVCQFEQLSHGPGETQQPATSAGSDRTTLT